MLDCCTSYIDLGCLDSCNQIDTTKNATQFGLYRFYVESGGIWYEDSFTPNALGDSIVFQNKYKSDALLVGKLYAPNGSLVTCVKFKNQIVAKW